MSKHRARINYLDPAPRALELVNWTTPPGAQPLGYIQRGPEEGRLLRLGSGALVMQLANQTISTLDQRKALVALQEHHPTLTDMLTGLKADGSGLSLH